MAERRKLESILTANGLVTEEQLKQIVSYAHAVGIDLHEAVMQKKIAPPEAVMQAYAESIGTPFIRFADLSVDEEVATRVDPQTARHHSFVPVSTDQGYLLLVTTKPVIPDVAEELRMIFNLPVKCTICMPTELSAAIAKYYPRDAVRTVQTSASGKLTFPASATKSSEPLSDEEKRDRRLKIWAAFNFVFAFFSLASPYFHLPKVIVILVILLLLLGVIVSGILASISWLKTMSR